MLMRVQTVESEPFHDRQSRNKSQQDDFLYQRLIMSHTEPQDI
jgi:hypothetical protein